jgi:hypothetical protein
MKDFSKEIVTGLLSVNEWHLAFYVPLTDLHSFYTIFTKKSLEILSSEMDPAEIRLIRH